MRHILCYGRDLITYCILLFPQHKGILGLNSYIRTLLCQNYSKRIAIVCPLLIGEKLLIWLQSSVEQLLNLSYRNARFFVPRVLQNASLCTKDQNGFKGKILLSSPALFACRICKQIRKRRVKYLS